MAHNAQFNAPRYKTKLDEWWTYDNLPQTLQRALQNAAFEWSAAQVYKMLDSRKMTEKQLVAWIARGDAAQIAKDAGRVWGIMPEVHDDDVFAA